MLDETREMSYDEENRFLFQITTTISTITLIMSGDDGSGSPNRSITTELTDLDSIQTLHIDDVDENIENHSRSRQHGRQQVLKKSLACMTCIFRFSNGENSA